MRGGRGPVSDSADNEPKDVGCELVDCHIRWGVVEKSLQEVVAVVLLAGNKVDERGKQPPERPYAGFKFLEIGLDVPAEDIGDFLCILSEGPTTLGVNIEEDKAKGGGRSATAPNRELADAREEDSHKLVNLLLGMDALWILFRLEWDTSLQTKCVSSRPFRRHAAERSTHNLLRNPMHRHNVKDIPHNVHIYSSTLTDARKHPLPVFNQLARLAVIHSDPLPHLTVHSQCPCNQFPGGGVLRRLIKREEEPVAIGEVLHRLAVHRLERAHVLQDTLNASQCVDGLAMRDGSGGRWKRLISFEDAHLSEVLFHLVRGDEGETAGEIRPLEVYREGNGGTH